MLLFSKGIGSLVTVEMLSESSFAKREK